MRLWVGERWTLLMRLIQQLHNWNLVASRFLNCLWSVFFFPSLAFLCQCENFGDSLGKSSSLGSNCVSVLRISNCERLLLSSWNYIIEALKCCFCPLPPERISIISWRKLKWRMDQMDSLRQSTKWCDSVITLMM